MAKGVRQGRIALMAIQMEKHLVDVVDRSIRIERKLCKTGKEPDTGMGLKEVSENSIGRCWSY
jgi:hypothetical protein